MKRVGVASLVRCAVLACGLALLCVQQQQWLWTFPAPREVSLLSGAAATRNETEGWACRDVGSLDAEQQCAFARQYCGEPFSDGFVNYVTLHYCALGGSLPVTALLVLLLLFCLFYFLGDTAEAFFCPALTAVSQALHLSPNVAGVTFLAFGNGAPDIAAIVVSTVSGNSGVGFGEPVGSGLFITTVVFGMVIMVAQVEVSRFSMLRDIAFYIVSSAFLLYLMASGKILLVEAVLLLVIYTLYVVTVFIGGVVESRMKGVRRARANRGRSVSSRASEILHSPSGDDDVPFLGSELQNSRTQSYFYLHTAYLPKIGAVGETSQGFIKVQKYPATPSAPSIASSSDVLIEECDHLDVSYASDPWGESDRCGFKGCFTSAWDKSLLEDSGTVRKFLVLAFLPFHLLQRMTIGPRATSPVDWNRFYATVSPLGLGLLALLVSDALGVSLGGVPLPVVVCLCALPVCLLIFVYTDNMRAPRRWAMVFVAQCFVASIMWIYLVANELVNVIESMGVILGVSDAILSVSLLAVGNSVGDMVANLVVSRHGFASMAVGACFGGPMLSLLIGIGASYTFRCVAVFPDVVSISVSATMISSMSFLLGSLAISFVVVSFMHRLPKWFGFLMVAFYAVSLVINVLTEANIVVW